MAQKIPFFELFTDFSPDFDLRVPLNAAMVTNMVLEPEKRTMTLDMTVRAEMNDSTRETVEQLLARNYDLKRVDIHVKSTAEAFPDMLKNAGRKRQCHHGPRDCKRESAPHQRADAKGRSRRR